MKTALPSRSFHAKLYLSLCIDAIISLTKEEDGLEEKVVEIIEPLLEELFLDEEILA